MTRKLRICLVLLTISIVLLTACSPPIIGDAGTYGEATPPPNHDSEMAAHEWRIQAKEVR